MIPSSVSAMKRAASGCRRKQADRAALVRTGAPGAEREQPALGLGRDRTRQARDGVGVAGRRPADSERLAHSTTSPWPPRLGSPAAASSPSGYQLDRRDAAEEEVAPAPAGQLVAERLEPVERRGIDVVAALALDERLVQVHARPRHRLLQRQAVADRVHHRLHDRSAQAYRAGAAEHQPRPPVGEHDRGRHHARQALPRALTPADQIVLTEDVVQVDAGAGHDHARAGAERAGERGGVAARVHDRDVRRAGWAAGLGQAGLGGEHARRRRLQGAVREQRLARPPRRRSAEKLPVRARVCSRMTSIIRTNAPTLPGSPPSPRRSSSRSPQATRIPPDEGGGLETNSQPR